MNEWTRFQQSGLLYDNCYFKPMFTLGDGNLDSLSVNKVYDSLLRSQKALNL